MFAVIHTYAGILLFLAVECVSDNFEYDLLKYFRSFSEFKE